MIIFFRVGVVIGIQYPFSECRNHILHGRRSVQFIRHAHGSGKFHHRIFRVTGVLFLRGHGITDIIEVQPLDQRIFFDQFFIIRDQKISDGFIGRIDEDVRPAFFALIHRAVVVVYDPLRMFTQQFDIRGKPHVEIFHPGMHFDAAFFRQSGERRYIIFISSVRSGNEIFMIFHVIGTEHRIAVEERFQKNKIDSRILIGVQRLRQRFQRLFRRAVPHRARRNRFAFCR